MTASQNEDRRLGRHDLLASFYTLSGAANGDPARHPYDDRVRAAAAAGYAALGLTPFDVEACTAGGRSCGDLAAIAADHGIVIAEIETFSFYRSDDADDDDAAHRFFTTGEMLGARHGNVLIG